MQPGVLQLNQSNVWQLLGVCYLCLWTLCQWFRFQPLNHSSLGPQEVMHPGDDVDSSDLVPIDHQSWQVAFQSLVYHPFQISQGWQDGGNKFLIYSYILLQLLLTSIDCKQIKQHSRALQVKQVAWFKTCIEHRLEKFIFRQHNSAHFT